MKEFGQHDQDRRSPRVATPREVAPPTLARNRQVGLVHQVLDHRDEFFRRVVAQEVIDPLRIDPAIAHESRVFVDADVEQVRQQADVLPQRQRAGRFGLGPRTEIEMTARTVLGQAELHADGIVPRERALVHPFQLQTEAGRPRQRRCAVGQQQRPCTIGQHPAQEVRVEVGFIPTRRETRALEKPRRHLAGHRHCRAMRTQLDALRRRLDRRDAGRADAVHRMRLHRLRRELALDHVGEPRHQRVAARGTAGQQRHARQLRAAALQAIADRTGGELRIGVLRHAFRIDGVVPREDAVLRQDAPLDALGHAVERCDVRVHAVVGNGLARHEIAGALEVHALE
jgi:hypothetical protein